MEIAYAPIMPHESMYAAIGDADKDTFQLFNRAEVLCRASAPPPGHRITASQLIPDEPGIGDFHHGTARAI